MASGMTQHAPLHQPARRFNPGKLLIYLILIAGVAVTLTPLIWTISTSLKSVQQLST